MSAIDRNLIVRVATGLAILGGLAVLSRPTQAPRQVLPEVATSAQNLTVPIPPAAPAVATESTRKTLLPPNSFRGIAWGSALPPVQKLRETALKGCVVFVEQNTFTDTPPCSHMHLQAEDQDLYTQRSHVAGIYGVPVTEQLLTWSYKKFWSGTVFVHNYSDADLTKLRDSLIAEYGQPTFANEELRLIKWQWPENKIEISLHYDPTVKRALGLNKPPETTLTLAFGKTE